MGTVRVEGLYAGAAVASLTAVFVTLLAGCAETARLPVDAGMGAQPQLPPPNKNLIPTVKVAPAVGWGKGAGPTPGTGLQVTEFAGGFDHPRWLYVLPNGDVLVAETNAPERPGDKRGIKGWFMKKAQARAGAGVPSANRITLLRDTDGDGRADLRTPFIENLSSPFGMALVGDRFYVANADAVVSFPYEQGMAHIAEAGKKLVDLPGGPINHHWTKNLIASPDGTHLFVTVGSNSNVGENGMENETGRAAVWIVDLPNGSHRIYASGLRNPNGMAWVSSDALWTAVNERDEIGSDLVPDYMTRLADGGFYGWPYSYFGNHVDERVKPPRPDLVSKAIVPDYALGPHTASLGLAYSEKNALPQPFQQGMFVGQHGSWNRKPPSGYRVIFVPFSQGRPSGAAQEILSGFLDEAGQARGRPVGVAFDKAGALLVADDVGNVVWRVTAAKR